MLQLARGEWSRWSWKNAAEPFSEAVRAATGMQLSCRATVYYLPIGRREVLIIAEPFDQDAESLLTRRGPRTTVASSSTMAPVGDKVWYFAYGSNMKSAVMERRGMRPLAVQRLVVPTHVLTFDIFGVPYSEPAMASIAERGTAVPVRGGGIGGGGGGIDASARNNRSQGSDSEHSGQSNNKCPDEHPPPVHGIGYLLSADDFKSLVISEGAGTAYSEIELQARRLDGGKGEGEGESLTVRTLVSRFPFRPNPLPSARYLVSLAVQAHVT